MSIIAFDRKIFFIRLFDMVSDHRLCTILLFYILMSRIDAETLLVDQANATRDYQPVNNIKFKIPDLNVKYRFNDVDVVLHGYKTDTFDQGNRWASIGYPFFVERDDGDIYEMDEDTISMVMRLLDDDQEEALKRYALDFYNKTAYVSLIPLQSITCWTWLMIGGKLSMLEGSALNLNHYDVIIQIACPEKSVCRNSFLARLDEPGPLQWRCRFEAGGREIFRNQLEITGEQLQEAANDHDLFGPKDQVMVTRKQLTTFVQLLRADLEIKEDLQFNEDFDIDVTEKLILLSQSTFQYVDVAEALESLSSIGFTMDLRDLQPDQLLSLLDNKISDVVRGQTQSGSDHKTESLEKQNENKSGHHMAVNANAGKFGSAGGHGGKHKEQSNTTSATKETSTTFLNGISNSSKSSLLYKWDGTQIKAKSMQVLLLQKMTFNRSISISYRKYKCQDAQYRKTMTMTSKRLTKPRMSTFDEKVAKLETVYASMSKLVETFEKDFVPPMECRSELPTMHPVWDETRQRMTIEVTLMCRDSDFFIVSIRYFEKSDEKFKRTTVQAIECCRIVMPSPEI